MLLLRRQKNVEAKRALKTVRWRRRHRKPGRPSSRANTRTVSSSVRTRECPRVRFVSGFLSTTLRFVFRLFLFLLRRDLTGLHSPATTTTTTGTYISNRASDKMCNLTDNVVMARSGSAADTEAVAGFVRHHCASHAIELDGDGTLDVKIVARILNKINYENKNANNGTGLGCYAICAGWDEKLGAQVYSCTAGGNMVKTPWTTDGSGSTYIWGFLDSEFKEEMTREECEKYVLKALTLAMAVDSSSGGCARLCTVNKDGCFRQFIKGDELERQLGEIHFKSGGGLGGGVVYGEKSGGVAI